MPISSNWLIMKEHTDRWLAMTLRLRRHRVDGRRVGDHGSLSAVNAIEGERGL